MTRAETAATGTRPAGIVTRVLAGIADAAVIVVIAAVGYLVWTVARLAAQPRTFSWPPTNVWLSTSALSVFAILYFTVFWSTSGRTPGAALLGTRVLSRRRHVLSAPAALLRAIGCVVLPIGLLWCALDGRRRSLQDLVLRSTVVYDWSYRDAEALQD
jgi:uncharacterized RDD family membrane protein YckC